MDQIILTQNNTSTHETYISDIRERISALTEAITQSSEKINTYGKNKESMKNNILKLNDLRGQYLRAIKTAEFIEEGLARDSPYVQRKFRVKISNDTPADEINLCK